MSPKCRWMASLASRCFARTITQREDVTVSGQSAMAATGQILLSAHTQADSSAEAAGSSSWAARRAKAVGRLPRSRTYPAVVADEA